MASLTERAAWARRIALGRQSVVRMLDRHDGAYHVDFLIGAVETGSPQAFAEYGRWRARTLRARGVAPASLVEELQRIGMLAAELAGDGAPLVSQIVAAGCAACLEPLPPPGAAAAPLEAARAVFTQAAVRGDRRAARLVAVDALRSGASLLDVYTHIFEASQRWVGLCWERNTLTVADEHLATAVTQSAMAQVFADADLPPPSRGTAIVTGIEGERHQIGAQMVADALALDGWRVNYLGTDLPQRDIIRDILRAGPRLLAVSVTMAFNVSKLGELIGAVSLAAGAEVKILVGGAAFEGMPGRAQQLGCDAFARNLAEAQSAARALAT